MSASTLIDTEKLLETFLAMVRINSPSGGEGEMRAWLRQRLELLGLSCREDAGGNLMADVPSNRCDHDAVLVLSGHMDVVPPCLNVKPVITGEGDGRIIYSDNTTVLGADDKSGLAPVLEALAYSLENDLPRPPLRLIFTTREEVGLGGAKDLADAELDARFALIFDHTGRQGVIIHRAPTHIRFEMEFHGKSVHAGIIPEQGLSAIVLASNVIQRLHLGRVDDWTTANVSYIDGGSVTNTNIVPDHVLLKGELRSHDPAVVARELQHIGTVIREEAEKMTGASGEFRPRTDCECYHIPADHPGIERVQRAARQCGLEPKLIHSNGVSDNNVFVNRGLPGVVLSAGFIEPHSLKECVRLSEMRQCAELILSLLSEFAQETF